MGQTSGKAPVDNDKHGPQYCLPVYTVDAFTSEPFAGNPAAVVLCTEPVPDDKKFKIAAEMNLSETAFVEPVGVKIERTGSSSSQIAKDFGGSRFSLRWFTPTVEVNLCGHATLATTAALFAAGNNNSVIEYETLSGVLKATRQPDGQISLDFPLNTCTSASVDEIGDYSQLFEAFTPPLNVKETEWSFTTKKLVVRLDDSVSRKDLESLSVDPKALVAASKAKGSTGDNVRGVIITMKGSDKYDFYSRYFAPWVGIDEDPVCGSAHTVLADYWCGRLEKSTMQARQVSPRGGDLTVVKGNDSRVSLAGYASIVLSGTLRF